MTTGGALSPRMIWGVVGDHVVEALPGDTLGLATGLLDRVGVARPAGGQGLVARLLEECRPRIP